MDITIFIASCTFIWIGFIGAISFMESWLKFRAPGITMPIGLSIGKVVFGALNKVEWALATIISVSLFFYESKLKSLLEVFFLIVIISLVVQTAWLLPALSKRVKAIKGGTNLSSSNHHLYYICFEFIKLLLLIFFGGGILHSVIR
ncbi:hypothetical protein FW778_17205 [Ginsengibacter hankyongi]|uniref:DUF4149 domain-containing protein n=1 Tax=Ginsengibacter hankyongi TaxID=2607284 RepID=A0A5J5IEW8_9BACT|nr:hypothetical protein [Ginsengibacter hankyongi]KAA9037167.1 hypothetical protein FW778_17205 [Ginsengibacter hankyongi]